MNRWLGLACLLLTAGPAAAAPLKAAVFDFQFSNLSPVPTDAADAARLKRVSAELRALLERKGLYIVISTDPVRAAVAKSAVGRIRVPSNKVDVLCQLG